MAVVGSVRQMIEAIEIRRVVGAPESQQAIARTVAIVVAELTHKSGLYSYSTPNVLKTV
jgi:hypothetical protein